jgi:membrane protease YdiL (CAAX protease family)
MKKISKVNLFYILVGVITLTVAGVFYFFRGSLNSTSGLIMASFYMFIPTISVLIVEKVIHKEKIKTIKKNLFISFKLNRWFLVAWLITPVIAFGSIGIALLFSDVSFSPEMEGMFESFENLLTTDEIQEMREFADSLPFHVIWIGLLSGMIAGITINAVFGFGEEIGWRGFLLRRFIGQKFFKVALVIGFVWGVWHFPIILMGHNYPTYPLIGVFMMIVWCVLLSPLFLYITIKAKSVIAAGIMHGTLNGTAVVALMVLKGGNELLVGMTGLSGFISLFMVTLLFFIYDKYISKEEVMLKKINLE